MNFNRSTVGLLLDRLERLDKAALQPADSRAASELAGAVAALTAAAEHIVAQQAGRTDLQQALRFDTVALAASVLSSQAARAARRLEVDLHDLGEAATAEAADRAVLAQVLERLPTPPQPRTDVEVLLAAFPEWIQANGITRDNWKSFKGTLSSTAANGSGEEEEEEEPQIAWDENDRITHLCLVDGDVVGSIPTLIGRLDRLTVLDLGSNGLVGDVPPQIGSLVNLTELHLDNNSLTGAAKPYIGFAVFVSLVEPNNMQECNNICNLTQLKELYLNNNQLTWPIHPEC
ncbi:hypothetical protein HK105_200075 [Polyrhizophydium stewartii]|uniref:Uncharacterized protein n=1 Tax=Polyrhizophydium stewartii TaxID=2732419 RepID=A0ABR4NKM1_9FUNG